MKNLFNNILNFLFPNVCGICDKLNKDNLCPKCNFKLKHITKYKIIQHNNKYFDEHLYVFKYEGIIREKIIQYKFYEKSYMYKTFAKIIIKNEKKYGFLENYGIIIPVPIHYKRKSERGYNQSSLISKELAIELNIKYIENVLYKIKNNTRQSLLNQKERLNNVKNAYKIENYKLIKNKNIILFDDIYTTGSTANECAKLLKQNGANNILVLTLAKD